MQLQKFNNKKNYKIGALVAVKGAVGFIVGFSDNGNYSNSFYLYSVLPLNFIITKNTDVGLDKDIVLKQTEGAIREAVKEALTTPMSEKRLLKISTTSSKLYMGEMLDLDTVLLWRTKSMLSGMVKTDFRDEYEMTFKVEEGRLYKSKFDTLYVALSKTKFVTMDTIEDWRMGKYDDYMRTSKKYGNRLGGPGIYTLSELLPKGIHPVDGKEDISWYEQKWKNI